MKKKKKSQLI